MGASQQDSSLAHPNALKHLLSHQMSNNSNKASFGSLQNPNTARAVYNLPITTANTSYNQVVLGGNLDAGSALTFLGSRQQQPGPQGHYLGNNSTIAGLAIISPRKAHALIQKAEPPQGAAANQPQVCQELLSFRINITM